MATKKQVRKKATHKKGAATAAHKKVVLKRHHAKPYRKRHIGLLVFSLIGLAVVIGLIITYRDQIIRGFTNAQNFVAQLSTTGESYELRVESSHGFSLVFDQKKYNASAIEGLTGSLFTGSELNTKRAYSVLRLSPAQSDDTLVARATFTLTYHLQDSSLSTSAATLRKLALTDGGIDLAAVELVSTDEATFSGFDFERSTWKTKDNLGINISSYFTTYAAIVDGRAVTIVVSHGLDSESDAFADVLGSLSLTASVSDTALSSPTASVPYRETQVARSMLDLVTLTDTAHAATAAALGAEQIAALYGPAVARVYNAFCMDIAIDGTTMLQNICSAASGSAFFVSQDGYMGTNGHVVVANPQDMVIDYAVRAYVTNGNSGPLTYLINLTSLRQSDIPSGATAQQTLGIIVDALYSIASSRITAVNGVQNLLVGLTGDQPDFTTWLEATSARRVYSPSTPKVQKAEVIAEDYRVMDGIDGFRNSDVAIIKVAGTQYPVTKLGDAALANQGSDLMILGYPGNATNNGIVESTTDKVTLTTGKVSAKKNASGSDRVLIETDTTIGHGNSGGPAFTADGSVVGIATYTADGSGSGDGVYNYVRDIRDLSDLAASEGVSFDTNSVTQAAWQRGVEFYYNSRYSRAIPEFENVLANYPYHALATEFIASAEAHIANGDDIQDFPIILVVVMGVVLLAGVGTGIFFIVRQKQKHAVYTAGVAQGTVQPVAVSAAPQAVTVSSPAVQPVGPSPVTTPLPPVTLPSSSATPVVVSPVVQQASIAPPVPTVTTIPVQTPDETPSTPAAEAEVPPFNPFTNTPPQ